MKMKLTLMVAAAAAFAAVQMAAMPTEEDVRRAEPDVKKLLAPERAALESGRKTRSEVAEAAMKLADEADSDAAKLLLMKGAFVLYVKDGNLEKAVETMNALEAAISDMPPQSITNMIEAALVGVPKKETASRLYRLLDESKAGIASHSESKGVASSVDDRSSVASILKGMIKVPGRDYWLSATELTQGQWEAVMGYNLSSHKGKDLPVENVNRDDCDVFLEKLNQTKEVKSSQFEFRLPELEEWKYAAWAGSAGHGSWIKPGVVGNVLDMAWVEANSSNQTHAVATKAPNAFGFYDMFGNVWEWLSKPGGDAPSGRGSLKGCAFNQVADKCTWNQNWHIPKTQRHYGVGLRLAAHIRSEVMSGGVGKEGSSVDADAQRQATVDGGYTWSYRVKNGEATLVAEKDGKYSCAVSPTPTGKVSIPPTLNYIKVTSIGREAFRNCTGLTSVTIPEGVKGIEWEAFRNCKNLTSVTIPDGVTHIDYSAFTDCGLTSVTLPSSLKAVGWGAFGRCAGLTAVTIPEGVTSIDNDAFNGCSGLKSVVIPNSVTRIGERAFLCCRELRSVTIPAKVASIGEGAFGWCSELKQINLAPGNQAFTLVDGVLYTKDLLVLLACPGTITSVDIPSSVTKIGTFAFGGCNRLTSVRIPESVKEIGSDAFKDCVELASVTMCGERPDASNDIFQRCGKLKSIHVPANAKSWTGMKDWFGIPLVFDRKDNVPAQLPADMSGTYCVIDISGGSNAEHYPVSYLDDVPEHGWGDEYKTTKIVLRRVDAGTYPMLGGRQVTFTKPFYMGIFELTQKQVKLLSGDDARKFVFAGDMRPADRLTWTEMRGKNEEFDYPKTKEVAPDSIIGRLRVKTGLFGIDLPTSYQFRCAWNAGTDGRGRDARSTGRHFSNQRDGKGGSRSKHTTVGSYLPNEWGIYDLHGNVWEMCLDRLVRQKAEVENDPIGPIEGAKRYLMGGCWNSTDGFSFSEFIPQNKEANGQTGKTGCRIVINVEMGKEAELRRAQSRKQSGAEHVDASAQGMNVAAKKLQGCDFLLNKDFKKNAKYYLCLFSASWCGPCRREMPRIAKTYAETLKDDPDIELIHFSWDQNDEKALAWAKEHDVKFPVVKPKGGNPLNLNTRDIPHLFIVKADGTLVEEGHPMKLFTSEKLRELKTANGGVGAKGKTKIAVSGKETIDDVEWTYSIKDGKAQLDYASSSNVTAITIPSTLGGCPVTSIRGRQYGQPGVFEKCCKLTAVTIPSSVTSIGARAFESCRELRTVTIQSSAMSIGSFAFCGCNSLASLVIPSGVTSIGCRAFACCRGLKSVTISSSVKRIERDAFLSCDNLMSISVEPDNPSYSSRNGLLCSKAGSILIAGVNGDVTIPSGVTRIGDGAFDGYGGLMSVTIPLSMTSIGCRAFAMCRGLKSVTIPSSVTSIGSYAFNGCTNLASITIPSSVTRIGSNAFNGTPFYDNMPEGMVVLGGGVLCGYKGKSSAITIPSNVTSIVDAAFSERILRQYFLRLRRNAGLKTEFLKTVVISSGVTNIGNCAFSYCSDLESVTMRGERPDAPNNIFERCGKLKSIHVPANAKSWAGMKEWQGIPLVFDAK